MDLPLAVSEKGGGISMKKGWKTFWIVCALCAGMGFVCCIVALIMGVTVEAIENRFPDGIHLTKHIGIFWSDDEYDDDDYDDVNAVITEGNTRQSYKNVTSIDLDVWAGQVEIITVKGGATDEAKQDAHEITIETKNIDKRLKLRYYMDEGELKIKTKKKLVHVGNASKGEICIYVPEGYRFEEASLNVGAGYMYVEDICAQELSVEVGAGQAEVDNFTAAEADLDCGTGEITATGKVDSKADVNCGVGAIVFNAKGKETDYNYSISCGIGEVECGDASYSGLGMDKEIDNSAGKEMEIECGIGQVTVKFTDEI